MMGEEEFYCALIKPIQMAYRNRRFLSETYEAVERAYWYQMLKGFDVEQLDDAVERYITANRDVPVLADIFSEIKC